MEKELEEIWQQILDADTDIVLDETLTVEEIERIIYFFENGAVLLIIPKNQARSVEVALISIKLFGLPDCWLCGEKNIAILFPPGALGRFEAVDNLPSEFSQLIKGTG